jgi:hypothetical protein
VYGDQAASAVRLHWRFSSGVSQMEYRFWASLTSRNSSVPVAKQR